uniref:Uncharacterized protein n=1 Tax=Rhabditophanes sp. KR3021 TaxID=114890 RepID=A0AC35UB20_9BILA
MGEIYIKRRTRVPWNFFKKSDSRSQSSSSDSSAQTSTSLSSTIGQASSRAPIKKVSLPTRKPTPCSVPQEKSTPSASSNQTSITASNSNEHYQCLENCIKPADKKSATSSSNSTFSSFKSSAKFSNNTSNYSNLSDVSVLTPPSYSVLENSEGEMINEKEGVIWPHRPNSGYHSLKEYKKRKARVRQIIKRREEKEEKAATATAGNAKQVIEKDAPKIKEDKKDVLTSGDKNKFLSFKKQQPYEYVGLKKEDDIKKLIAQKNIFYLFYEHPQDYSSVPFAIVLKVAYYDENVKKTIVKVIGEKKKNHLVSFFEKNEIR